MSRTYEYDLLVIECAVLQDFFQAMHMYATKIDFYYAHTIRTARA